MTTAADTLSPCPKCGAADPTPASVDKPQFAWSGHWVQCNPAGDCLFQGPIADTPTDAAAAWNALERKT